MLHGPHPGNGHIAATNTYTITAPHPPIDNQILADGFPHHVHLSHRDVLSPGPAQQNYEESVLDWPKR